ncbi:MAG: hypothetical protein K0R34_2973 [Herbinix sp.]|jgi:hypothetical protein|nr:hypothetical protein [Herbinix sp.]
MEQMIGQNVFKEIREWNDTLEVQGRSKKNGDETESLFMVEEIEAI